MWKIIAALTAALLLASCSYLPVFTPADHGAPLPQAEVPEASPTPQVKPAPKASPVPKVKERSRMPRVSVQTAPQVEAPTAPPPPPEQNTFQNWPGQGTIVPVEPSPPPVAAQPDPPPAPEPPPVIIVQEPPPGFFRRAWIWIKAH